MWKMVVQIISTLAVGYFLPDLAYLVDNVVKNAIGRG